MAEIVATTSLPVNRLTPTDCNAAARANYMPHATLSISFNRHRHNVTIMVSEGQDKCEKPLQEIL